MQNISVQDNHLRKGQTPMNELRAINDSRNSFYGKANVINEDGKTKLKSYSTIVAYIENDKAVVNGTYSPTTLRHIKEFLLQHGFKADNKSQIIEDYPEPEDTTPEETPLANHMKSISMVCAMGSLLSNTPKEQNTFDKRMLGTINGISFPDDFDTLPEEEKTKRLQLAKEQLA